MIEQLAWKFSKFVKENNPNTKSLEVINYGMTIIIGLLITSIITIISSIIMGTFLDTLIVMIAFVILRQFTGGYHIKNSDLCAIISSLLLVSISYINSHVADFSFALNIITIVVLLLFAPHTMKFNFSESPRTHTKYKLISIVLVLLNFLVIKSDLLTTTFFIVSLTVLIGLIGLKPTKVERRA